MTKVDGSVTATQAPVAIIGMGCLFPHAPSLREYWKLIRWSEDSVTDVPATHWSIDDYYDAEANGRDLTYCRRGAFLSPVDFDPMAFGIPPSTLEATDTAQLLGLMVAKSALEDAGYGSDRDFDRGRTGVILGVTGTLELVIPLGARMGHPHWRRAMLEAGVPADVSESIIERIAEQYVPWQENSFPGLLGNVVAGRIANRLNLRGTNCVVDAACASSLSAIHLSLLELSAGRTDMVVTGGVDALNDIFMFMCFSKTQALSPTGDARPFAKDADGTVIGEGMGMIVLKRLADAERDGDRVYAVIRGVGTSSDGKSQSIYAPRSEGQAEALRSAYRISGVDPSTVQLVEAHGTGTKVGDVVEFDALKTVYREAQAEGKWCGVGSVKSQIGHTKAASGVAGIIKTALALHHKVLPATIKVDEANPNLDIDASPFYLSTETRPWVGKRPATRRSSVSSFGFGGSNFHAVLEEYGDCKSEVSWDGTVTIIAFSADTQDELAKQLSAWCAFVGEQKNGAEIAFRACESRRAFRAADDYRLLVVSETGDDLVKLLSGVAERLRATASGTASWNLPSVYYGGPQARGKIAFLFPGQASQYVGMGRDFACMFPEAQEAVALADGVCGLCEQIYPHPVFDKDERAKQQAELTRTEIAQPAIGAVSLACLRVLERFGVRADFVAGHSYGELVALRAAGRIDDATLRHLSSVRGQLMAEGSSEPGTMLAVRAPLDDIDAMLAEEASDVVLAHRNGPTQGILSGSIAAIEAVGAACASRGWQTTRLRVSAAFHSGLMTSARDQFRAALNEADVSEGSIPVIANRTADAYPKSPDTVRDMLADQLVCPVDFVQLIENMRSSGVRLFVEVGPRNVLSGLVRSILGDGSQEAVSVDASCGRASGVTDLARVLARLGAMGHEVDIAAWEPDVQKPQRPAMAVPLIGANYRSPGKKKSVEPVRSREAIPVGNNGKNYVRTTVGNNGKNTAPQTVRPTRPAPAQAAAAAPGVMQVVQEGLRAMQALQQQTAEAHQRFLHGQELAQQTFQKVLEHQQRLVEHSLGMPVSAPAVLPAIAPMPRYDTLAPVEAPIGGNGTPRPPVAAPPAEVRIVPPETPVAAPVVAEAPAQSSDATELETTLLEVVAELTGYPIEMLDPDMDLEADLGIDSIKRVEILASVQTRIPGLDAVDSSYMGSLRTLRNIVDYMASPDGGEDASSPPSSDVDVHPERAHASVGVSHDAPSSVERSVLRAVERPAIGERGGITIAPGCEVWVLEDNNGLAKAISDRLVALGTPSRVVATDAKVGHNGDARVGGLVIVASPNGAWDEQSEQALKDAFTLTQRVGTLLCDAANEGGSLFATVSRMDGAFGLAGGEFDPVQGGLAGLTKTVAHEWTGVRAKALDVAADWTNHAAAAEAVVGELSVEGPIEVGLDAGLRRGLELVPEAGADVAWTPEAGQTIVISGGARGVTAEVAHALAAYNNPTLVLLGRSSSPEDEPAWLKDVADEAEIKRAIIANAFDEAAKPTPAEVEDAYRRCVRDREVRATVARLEGTGATVLYRSVDVRDQAAVADVIAEVKETAGPIRALIHGAGVIADRWIADKRVSQFDRVFDTKVAGLRNLLEAIGNDDLKQLVLFSSVSGRFGRQGQVDYAMANEVLNKVAHAQSRLRPTCRVVSINWGPWEGGMVTPGLRKEFARIGVGLVPLKEGAESLVAELSRARGDVEVMIGCAIPNADGGFHATQTSATTSARGELSPAFKRLLDIDRHPFLRSHVIGGHPVLPVAMILEWLGHGALHDNPGLLLHGFEDFRVLKGVVLTNGPADLRVTASKARRNGAMFEVDVELRGHGSDGRQTPHARARAILAMALPTPPAYRAPEQIGCRAYARGADGAYGEVLFHGPDFQGIERIDGYSGEGMVAYVRSAAGPADWMSEPVRSAWLGDPLVLDAGLQIGILWCHEELGAVSLPSSGAGYYQYRPAFPENGVSAVLEIRSAGETQMTADVTFLDDAGIVVAQMKGFSWTVDASLQAAFGRVAVAGARSS